MDNKKWSERGRMCHMQGKEQQQEELEKKRKGMMPIRH